MGSFPLHYSGSKEVAEFFLTKGIDINIRNYKGETPLHTAVKFNREETAFYLLSKGADPNARNMWNHTPLYYPESGERYNIMKELIAHGATVNITDANNHTPLYYAAMHDKTGKTVELLLSKGAKVNIKNDVGSTPLHISTFTSNLKAAEILLSAGADLNAKNKKGETPIDCALSNTQNRELAKLFLSRGANVGLPKIYHFIKQQDWKTVKLIFRYSSSLWLKIIIPLILLISFFIGIIFLKFQKGKKRE